MQRVMHGGEDGEREEGVGGLWADVKRVEKARKAERRSGCSFP